MLTLWYPVINSEDVMALTLIRDFLAEHRAKTRLRVLAYPQISKDPNYCAEQHKLIEKHNGHVVYVCFNSVPREEWEYLAKLNFPYTFERDAEQKPFYKRYPEANPVVWPIDGKRPQPWHSSLVAKFRRANKRTNGYIAAGLHGIGTGGAAKFLVTHSNMQMIASSVGSKPFCVMVDSKLDPASYEITTCAVESAVMPLLEMPRSVEP